MTTLPHRGLGWLRAGSPAQEGTLWARTNTSCRELPSPSSGGRTILGFSSLEPIPSQRLAKVHYSTWTPRCHRLLRAPAPGWL